VILTPTLRLTLRHADADAPIITSLLLPRQIIIIIKLMIIIMLIILIIIIIVVVVVVRILSASLSSHDGAGVTLSGRAPARCLAKRCCERRAGRP